MVKKFVRSAILTPLNLLSLETFWIFQTKTSYRTSEQNLNRVHLSFELSSV